MNWCWVTGDANFGGDGNYSTQVAQYVAWFQQSNYQKVLTNRPVLFLLSNEFNTFSSLTTFAAAITALRVATVTAGLGTPYIVLMGFTATATATALGADAISTYVGPNVNTQLATFAANTASVEAYWTSQKGHGFDVVPAADMGWDTRPRIESPVRWEVTSSSLPPFAGDLNYVAAGTLIERGAHITNLVNFITANPTACPATLGLVYSWDECDEGGGTLIPTIGDPPVGASPSLNGILTEVLSVLGHN